MDGSVAIQTGNTDSSSSSSEGSLSDGGRGPEPFLRRHRGHEYGRTSINSGSAHLGDSYVINHYHHPKSSSHRTPPDIDINYERRHSRSRERRRKWSVPQPSTSYFTGRQIQLQQLKSYLLQDADSDAYLRKIVVVVGLGGSGKTQFCLRFAEENVDRYWGVFWIDASNQETAELGWADIGNNFGRGRSPAAGKHWLSQIRKPWLLILDNADNDDLDLAYLLPSGISGHILVTTRRNSLQEYATVGTIRLDKMEPEEAINLLLKAAYSEEDWHKEAPRSRSIAQTIAEKLDYLAIALHQAGRTIRCKICTLEKYLSIYSGYQLRPPGTSFPSIEVVTTWEIPFQKLESRSAVTYQDAVTVLHLLAFMHHQPVHESIIHASWSTIGQSLKPQVDLPPLLRLPSAEINESQSRLRLALSILYEHSIIEFDPGSGICSIHPVIHQWARYRIGEQGKTTFWLRCSLHVLTCACLTTQETPGEFTSDFLLPHLDSFLAYARESDPTLFETLVGATCAEAIAKVYERGANWQKSLQLLEDAMVYRSRTQGKYHDNTLKAMRNASLCHWNLFELKDTLKLQREIWLARWWKRQSFFDWSHPYRPQHVEYGIALSDLTQSLWLAGDHLLSKQTGERAVYILKKRLGDFDTRTVDAMFNLARTYRHMGLLDQAHVALIQVRKFRSKMLGLNHPDTLMVRNEVGMNLCGMGRHLHLAERTVRNVLKARDRILGAEHAYTLWSVNDLSKVLCALGRSDEAIQILENIIPAVSRTLGDHHVGMHMTKGNLARALAYAERRQETKFVLKEMLDSEELGLNERVAFLRGLGRTHLRLKEVAEAEKTCNNLLYLLKDQRYAKVHVNAINEAAGLLREVYLLQGNTEKANEVARLCPGLQANVLEHSFDLT